MYLFNLPSANHGCDYSDSRYSYGYGVCKCSDLRGVSVWSQTHCPGAGLPSEGTVLNKVFHRNSISFMAQRLPLLVPINILVILSLTSSFHKLIVVAKADLGSKTTKGKILDSELCTVLALD